MNYTAYVQNVAARAPCAWSAKHYCKETHCCNDDQGVKMLHSTAVLANLAYRCYIFDDYQTCSVLVKIYKNVLGV